MYQNWVGNSIHFQTSYLDFCICAPFSLPSATSTKIKWNRWYLTPIADTCRQLPIWCRLVSTYVDTCRYMSKNVDFCELNRFCSTYVDIWRKMSISVQFLSICVDIRWFLSILVDLCQVLSISVEVADGGDLRKWFFWKIILRDTILFLQNRCLKPLFHVDGNIVANMEDSQVRGTLCLCRVSLSLS